MKNRISAHFENAPTFPQGKLAISPRTGVVTEKMIDDSLRIAGYVLEAAAAATTSAEAKQLLLGGIIAAILDGADNETRLAVCEQLLE